MKKECHHRQKRKRKPLAIQAFHLTSIPLQQGARRMCEKFFSHFKMKTLTDWKAYQFWWYIQLLWAEVSWSNFIDQPQSFQKCLLYIPFLSQHSFSTKTYRSSVLDVCGNWLIRLLCDSQEFFFPNLNSQQTQTNFLHTERTSP